MALDALTLTLSFAVITCTFPVTAVHGLTILDAGKKTLQGIANFSDPLKIITNVANSVEKTANKITDGILQIPQQVLQTPIKTVDNITGKPADTLLNPVDTIEHIGETIKDTVKSDAEDVKEKTDGILPGPLKDLINPTNMIETITDISNALSTTTEIITNVLTSQIANTANTPYKSFLEFLKRLIKQGINVLSDIVWNPLATILSLLQSLVFSIIKFVKSIIKAILP